MDWPADDRPVRTATRAGPILSVPRGVELNDSPAMVMRRALRHIPARRDKLWVMRPGELADHVSTPPEGTIP